MPEPTDEKNVRLGLMLWRDFDRLARIIGDAYVQIARPHMRKLPWDAHLSVDGDTVTFTWTDYFSDGSRDGDEIVFPLPYLWTEDWQTEARAQKAARDAEIAERQHRNAVAQAQARLAQAQQALDYAQAQAEQLGIK